MIYDWTTEIDIKQDNVLEIPVPEAIEGEVVQGDRLRVRVIVEEVLIDGEAEDLKRWYREAKAELEAEGDTEKWVSLRQIIAEREAEASAEKSTAAHDMATAERKAA